MTPAGLLLAAVGTPAPPAAEGLGVAANLLIACSLLVVGLGLIALEFLLISGGAIGITAAVSVIAAVWFAFAAGQLTGWIFIVLVPISSFLTIRAGLQWMQRSSMVVQSEIKAHAGYGHVASEHGVAVGSAGVLVTDAFPTGRARFTGPAGATELDVAVRGAVLGKGAPVVVRAIEGAAIIVGPAPLPPSTPSAS